MKPRPFQVHIAEGRLADLRRRLNATSWPGDFGNADWRYGVEEGWLRDMVAYWANDFDWRAQEAKMNAFPQFQVEIDGVTIQLIAPISYLLRLRVICRERYRQHSWGKAQCNPSGNQKQKGNCLRRPGAPRFLTRLASV